jgi:hypothetical protein
MRIPSLSFVASETEAVVRRFPAVCVFAVLATTAGVLLIEESQGGDWRMRLMLTATLGLPLSTALAVFREKRGWGPAAGALLHLVLLAVLGALFFAWPHWQDPVVLRRYVQFSLGFHLLAAFLPFTGPGELNGFWQYNRTLFLRFLLSGLYAGVLFAGLAVAILALDKLFGLSVDEERYAELWVLMAFLFTTGFFLGGIPRDLDGLDAVTDYPRGLRIFSQFILLPLVGVYLVILTVYMGKIVITRVWPSGWIGYLVSSVAAAGILLLLLVFPVQERAENRWVRTYARWFYVILLPSIAMLLLAIFKRVGQYGLTENRYFMVVLSFWLAAIAVYFILSRGKSIKIIPASLCVLAFVTAFGPWGAYGMSARSQTERLRGMLAAQGVLVNGRIQPAAATVSFGDRREMSAVLTYLLETHGTKPIADWFPDGLAWADTVGEASRMGSGGRARVSAEMVMEAMGLAYVNRWQREDRRDFHWVRGGYAVLPPIAGYTTAFETESMEVDPLILDGRRYALDYDAATASLRFREGDDVLIRIPLRSVIDRALERTARGPSAGSETELTLEMRTSGAPDSMIVRAENPRMAVLLAVRSIGGYEDEAGPSLTGFSGTFFVRF